jgi:hypothetical protein
MGLRDEKLNKNGVALGRTPDDAKAVAKFKKQIKNCLKGYPMMPRPSLNLKNKKKAPKRH